MCSLSLLETFLTFEKLFEGINRIVRECIACRDTSQALQEESRVAQDVNVNSSAVLIAMSAA